MRTWFVLAACNLVLLVSLAFSIRTNRGVLAANEKLVHAMTELLFADSQLKAADANLMDQSGRLMTGSWAICFAGSGGGKATPR